MGLDINSAGDLIAVSRIKQSDAQTAATLGALIEFDEASQINVVEDRQSNADDKTGFVEATDIDILGKTAEGTLTQAKATPDGIGFAAAFALGDHAVSSPQAGTFLHLSRLVAYPDAPPYFTAAHRKGGSGASAGSADLVQHIGLGINTWGLNMTKGEWMTHALGVLGVGRSDDDIPTTVLSALDNATTLDISSIGDVIAEDKTLVTVWADLDGDGIYETEVSVTAVDNTLNTLTITSLGGAGASINYRVSYQLATVVKTWTIALTALSVPPEYKLRTGNIELRIGGVYSEPAGVPTLTGGQVAACEVESLESELNWNGEAEKCWRSGATEDLFGTAVLRKDPVQTITVNRRVRDYLLKQNFDANTAFSIRAESVGPVINAGVGAETFLVRTFWPYCKILSRDLQISDKKWVEAGTILAMKDASNNWPTMVVQSQNEVATYLA